jgi:site-specific recombinase XerD
MENFVNSIWMNFEKEIFDEFKFEDFILTLKIQWLAFETQQYYLKYIKNFITHRKFLKIWDFNNLIKLRFAYYKLTDKWILNNTIAKYYKCIRKYYLFLKEIEIADKILIDDLKKVKVSKSLPKALSEEDVIEIRKYLKWKNTNFTDIRDYLIFETFINTWIRRSELKNLKLENVSKNSISIVNWKWWKDRIVYISNSFSRIVNDYILHVKEKFDYKNSNYLFWDLSKEWINLVISRISRFSKIKIHPHLLRHTYASLCIKKWVNLYTLQQQMWHTDLKTTSVYLYLNSRENWEEIQKLQI